MFFDIPFKVNAIDTLIRHRLLSFFSKYWSICATLLLSRKCCGIHPENSCPWSCLSEFPCFYHERPHSGDDSSHYLTLLRKNAIIIIIVFFLIDFMLFQAACTYDKIFNDLLVVTQKYRVASCHPNFACIDCIPLFQYSNGMDEIANLYSRVLQSHATFIDDILGDCFDFQISK